MLSFLKNASPDRGPLSALVAVGGKPPRQCMIVAWDELGIALRWDTLSETYLIPWVRIEAIILKQG